MGRREIAELAGKVSDSVPSIERPAEQLAVVLSELKHELDSIDQMNEIESLRLQMTMDRLAKITAALSAVTSRVNDTEDAIRKHLR
jgi:chromosome segregation ATPase